MQGLGRKKILRCMRLAFSNANTAFLLSEL
jgi:hypothetical protein